MTGSEFNAEYKLGQRIASGSVESFLAHGTPTRRLVMVHRLTGVNDGERRRINYLLDALPTRATTVLSRVDVDDVQVVVTEFLPDFVNLRDWLEAAVATQTTVVIRTGVAASPAPPSAPNVTAAPTDAGGEFTQLFGAPVPTPSTPPPAPPVAPATHGTSSSAPPSSAPPSSAPPSSPPPGGPATGSFTALFGAAPQPSPSTVPSAPSPPREPEPSTAAAPPPTTPPSQPPHAAPQPSVPPPTPRQGSSFTELFGAALTPSDTVPSSAPAPAPATRNVPPNTPAPITPPNAEPARPVAASQRPGDFTLMFGAAAPPSSDPLPPPSAQPPPMVAAPQYAPPPRAPAPSAPASAGVPPSVPGEPPKIRVSWRPRESGPPAPPAAMPVGATGAMQPAAPPPLSLDGPPPLSFNNPPPNHPSFAPPSPPAPLGPARDASATPPPFALPSAGPPASAPSMGPPELRLYSNEVGERVEPYAPPPVPSSAPVPRAGGPSDFTRMLTPVEAPASAPPPPAVKPAPQQAAAGGGRKPSALPLIIAVNIAAIAAVGLILYFVLRG